VAGYGRCLSPRRTRWVRGCRRSARRTFEFFIDGLDGARDSEAGGHPYQLTTTIDLDSVISKTKQAEPVDTSVQDIKDVVVDLPLGFVGSTLAAPQCTLAELFLAGALSAGNSGRGYPYRTGRGRGDQ